MVRTLLQLRIDQIEIWAGFQEPKRTRKQQNDWYVGFCVLNRPLDRGIRIVSKKIDSSL